MAHRKKLRRFLIPEFNQNIVKSQESKRDYFTASLRPIQHLIQIFQNPDLELAEPSWELYKVSISFQFICKFWYVS